MAARRGGRGRGRSDRGSRALVPCGFPAARGGRVTGPMGVGVVGCGVIAARYVADSSAFASWQPVACADLDDASARALAAEHDLRAESVDELLADPDVELV